MAERMLAEIIRTRDLEQAGLQVEQGLEVAFKELVDEYLNDVRVRATPRSFDCRNRSLKHFSESARVHLARDVTPATVEGFLHRRVRSGRSPRTVNNDLLAIKACLNHAVRCGRIAANPIESVRPLPFRGRERRNPRALSEEECVELLNAATEIEGSPAAPRVVLLHALVETGARWNELTTTQWGDISWMPGELRLRSETTKNRTERVIPLAPGLLSLLRERAGEDMKDGRVPPGGLVFKSPQGHPWGLSHNFRKWLHRVLERAGIPRRDSQGRVLNVHALRHTFATRLARAGVPIQQAAYLTGHKTISVLMQVYTHMQAEDARAAVTRIALSTRIQGSNLPPAREGPPSVGGEGTPSPLASRT